MGSRDSTDGMDRFVAGERGLLEAMLDVERGEVTGILAGLDEDAARARLVPSLTTPLSLVKHATFVEKVWFHSRVAGVPRGELGLPDAVDESFVLAPGDTVGSVRDGFLEACAHSRQVAADRDLDEEFAWYERSVSLRYIYVHMIAELARHAGHGDILVEQLKSGRPGGTATR